VIDNVERSAPNNSIADTNLTIEIGSNNMKVAASAKQPAMQTTVKSIPKLAGFSTFMKK